MENLKVPSSKVVIHDDEIACAMNGFESILKSGRLSDGECTKAFEQALAASFGVEYAVATSSGTSALEIILRGLELAGRTVLVPVNTNFATAISALNAGANVRFYDSDLYPSMESIENSIDSRTRAIMVVHLGGHISPEMSALTELCNRRNILLIEDAAHAHGSSLGGRRAGQFGVAAALSFYQTKALPTGEGGAILTDNEPLALMARSYRSQGLEPLTDFHVRHGSTWRMSEFEASLGLVLLKSLDEDCAWRTGAIRRYRSADLRELTFPVVHDDEILSGYKCVGLLEGGREQREHLRADLMREGIKLCREVYSVPLHRQPIFAGLADNEQFPHADYFADHHISLPMWRGIDLATIDTVVDALCRYVR